MRVIPHIMRACSAYRHIAIAGVVACFMLYTPCTAQAADVRSSVYVCAANYGYQPQPSDFTIIIVACLQNSLVDATTMMLSALSDYMAPIVAILSTILITFLGIRVLSGEHGLLGKSAGVMIRLVLVSIFCYNLGGLAPWIFAIENEFITLTSGGFSPWHQIDGFLGNLLGFAPGLMLFQGVIGLIGAAFTSMFTGQSSLGGLMVITGSMAILKILKFISEVVYTYISALIIIGFLLVLSPIVVPLALFTFSERHFKKWVDLIVSAMLVPALLFASLYLFLGIFDTLIQNVFNILGGHDFRAYWKMNKPVVAWLIQDDPGTQDSILKIAKKAATSGSPLQTLPPVQTNIYAMMRHAFNGGSVANMPGVNFGSNNTNVIQALSFAFVELIIFASLFQKVVYQMPALASSIAGVVTMIPMSGGSFRDRAREMTNNMAVGAGAIGGGVIGGIAGSKVGNTVQKKAVNKQIGGVGGAIFGAMAASRAEGELWK